MTKRKNPILLVYMHSDEQCLIFSVQWYLSMLTMDPIKLKFESDVLGGVFLALWFMNQRKWISISVKNRKAHQ